MASAAPDMPIRSTAVNSSGIPPVSRSIMSLSSSGGISDAATDAATHSSVLIVNIRCDRTAALSAEITPAFF